MENHISWMTRCREVDSLANVVGPRSRGGRAARAGVDLLVISDCVIDAYLSIDGFPLQEGSIEASPNAVISPGGSCLVASAAAMFGARTAVVDVVGDDPLGSHLISAMESRGVSMRHVRRSGSTALVVVLEDGRGHSSFVGSWGSGSLLSMDDLTPALDEGPRAVYVSGYVLLGSPRHEAVLRAVELARSGGATLAVDPGPLVRSSGQLLRSADIIMLNEEELGSMPGELRPDATVVVKMGARGAVAHVAGSRVESPALRTEAVISYTGAGDVFNGVLLAELLSGLDLKEALDRANAAAGLKLRGRGLDSVPNPDEVDDALLAGCSR